MKGVTAAVSAGAALAGLACASNCTAAVYRDPSASIDDRVADLVKRMTVEEKAAQLIQGDVINWLNLTDGSVNKTGLAWNMEKRAGAFFVGRAAEFSVMAKGIKIGQDYLRDETPHGIPAWTQSEGIRGFLLPNATIFASPLSQGCSFNVDLIEEMATAIGQEARAVGANQVFGPVGDLARELRFGRVEEMFTEDPFLSGELAYAYVKGVQSQNVSATVKHFAGYGSVEQGLNTAPVKGGQRELLTTYLPSYKRAIEAGALSIMSAYHCYDAIPSVADYQILTEILREQWGYEYYVISDAGGTDRLCNAFSMCQADPIDSEAVVTMALPAGNDVEMGGGSYNFELIPDLVDSGKLEKSVVDTAVSRVLRAKFALGLFDNYWPGVESGDPEEFAQYIHTNKTVDLARRLDTESIILLENKDNVLPLKKDANVAVIGPMAHGFVNYGDYVPAGAPSHGVTPLDGIRAVASDSGKVTFAHGCDRWSNSQEHFPEAIETAKAADVAVVVVGTWSRDQGELWTGANATTGEHIDIASLDLVGAMGPLVSAIIDTGVPTVVVYSSGKPVTEPWISRNASALVQQFYGSEQGGNALADVLYGVESPSGKLSVGVPYDVGATPTYYDYLNSARGAVNPGHIYPNGTLVFGNSYVFTDPQPQYPFGYGLSYADFSFGDELRLSRSTVSQPDDASTDDTVITATVSLTNTHESITAKEVVQIYVRDLVSSVVVPNIQLKGFKKVELGPGESKDVSIDIRLKDLGLWDHKLRYVVEKGDFVIYAGAGSGDLRVNATLTVE